MRVSSGLLRRAGRKSSPGNVERMYKVGSNVGLAKRGMGDAEGYTARNSKKMLGTASGLSAAMKKMKKPKLASSKPLRLRSR